MDPEPNETWILNTICWFRHKMFHRARKIPVAEKEKKKKKADDDESSKERYKRFWLWVGRGVGIYPLEERETGKSFRETEVNPSDLKEEFIFRRGELNCNIYYSRYTPERRS